MPFEVIADGHTLKIENTSGELLNNRIRPPAGIKFAFDTGPSKTQLLLQYTDTWNKTKLRPGIWRVRWLLLFRRHVVELDIVEPEEPPGDEAEQASPKMQTIFKLILGMSYPLMSLARRWALPSLMTEET